MNKLLLSAVLSATLSSGSAMAEDKAYVPYEPWKIPEDNLLNREQFCPEWQDYIAPGIIVGLFGVAVPISAIAQGYPAAVFVWGVPSWAAGFFWPSWAMKDRECK